MIDRLLDLLASYDREPLQDACGIVGIFSFQPNYYFQRGLAALRDLQTRGYDGVGFISMLSNGTYLIHKKQGTIHEAFPERVIDNLSSYPIYNAQYQTRYGTNGEFNDANVQPFAATHQMTGERFVVSHNGQFSKKDNAITASSDTAKFVQELANSDDDNWDERIINTIKKQMGAWSLIITTENAMYLTRDPLGIRPLYYGIDGFVVIAASETKALTSAGFYKFYEVLPGQMVKVDRISQQITYKQIMASTKTACCMFENVYTQEEDGVEFFPRKNNEDVNKSPLVRVFRQRCGEQLAREAPMSADQIDFVIGIPATGITGAEAYARALNLPYRRAITDKNTEEGEQRTFMQAHLETILRKVQEHFIFDTEALRGKRVVIVDDSLVRGNVTYGIVKLLKEQYGVKKIHVRILCPPIDKACHLGINTRSSNELIAAQYKYKSEDNDHLIEDICKAIGADSLSYLSDEGLLWAATGNLNTQGFCMGCMVERKHPVDPYGNFQ